MPGGAGTDARFQCALTGWGLSSSVTSESDKISLIRPGASGMRGKGANATAAGSDKGSDCSALMLRSIGVLAAAGRTRSPPATENAEDHSGHSRERRPGSAPPAVRWLPGLRRHGLASPTFQAFPPSARAGACPSALIKTRYLPSPGFAGNARAVLDGAYLHDFRDVVFQHVLDAHLQVMVELGQPWHDP